MEIANRRLIYRLAANFESIPKMQSVNLSSLHVFGTPSTIEETFVLVPTSNSVIDERASEDETGRTG